MIDIIIVVIKHGDFFFSSSVVVFLCFCAFLIDANNFKEIRKHP